MFLGQMSGRSFWHLNQLVSEYSGLMTLQPGNETAHPPGGLRTFCPSFCLDGSLLFFRHQFGYPFLGEDFHELEPPHALCLLHGTCLNRSYIGKQIGSVVCLIPAFPAEQWVPQREEKCRCCSLAHCFISSPSSVPGTWLSANLCGLREGHRVDAHCLLARKNGRMGGSAQSLTLGVRIERTPVESPFPGCWSYRGSCFLLRPYKEGSKEKKEHRKGAVEKRSQDLGSRLWYSVTHVSFQPVSSLGNGHFNKTTLNTLSHICSWWASWQDMLTNSLNWGLGLEF